MFFLYFADFDRRPILISLICFSFVVKRTNLSSCCVYNIIILRRSSYENRNENVQKNNELVILLKIKLKTFCKIFSIIQTQKYKAKISRDSFDPFGKSFQKTSAVY